MYAAAGARVKSDTDSEHVIVGYRAAAEPAVSGRLLALSQVTASAAVPIDRRSRRSSNRAARAASLRPIDGPGRVHQADMAERLGKIAEQLSRHWIDLF